MKKLILLTAMLCTLLNMGAQQAATVVADEGAWCWFADPRALHYENAGGTINATYIGYIDVHGNVKATQYNWLTGRKTDVLVRSCFQPDDHNNPTFLVLPDERVMIFYTRHTDEACIWYRISQKPGDITALGDEKRLATQNNTTYPSPFILSDDPTHIYLCWRGINWHPTIARLTMPDASDDCQFDFGPRQIVQSTGARPYAKYQSNGKDKIYVSYTTGHPDNEQPDWLYFNVIDINHGNGPVLRDLNGRQLSVISSGAFNVSKTDTYANNYPATIVDRTANIRNWVWQIALDKDEHPVIAYPHIDNAKTTHVYWYARWNGSAWKNTWVQYGGHAFHQNWNRTELCYSGGMALDPDNINDLYLSIPTKDGKYDKDGIYELWKYTIDDDGKVAGSEQLTFNSPKNNVRPFVIPGSKNSPLRLAWMRGDYYYWMVNKNYPKGYPTCIMADYDWQEELTKEAEPEMLTTCQCFGANNTLTLVYEMNSQKYEGTLLTISGDVPLTYRLRAADQYPELEVGGKVYRSQNRLMTSDDWAVSSTGTSGDNHPTKLGTWVLTLTYDGKVLTTYRNGLVDQVVEVEGISGTYNPYATVEGQQPTYNNHKCMFDKVSYACLSPLSVQAKMVEVMDMAKDRMASDALDNIKLPAETRTDLVLPTEMYGLDITWTSSDEKVISANGVLVPPTEDKEVTLTATCRGYSDKHVVKALARDITKNLRYELPQALDLTANTATGFSTNKYGKAPQGLLEGLRSYTFLATVKATALTGQPRIYDFGSGSGNSLFLRANPLSAGIKYNGGTTTMVNGTTQLTANKEYRLAVTYDAGTHTTTIYIDGEENVAGTANQNEAYMLYNLAADARNYIGRTQWWDGAYANDNQDFRGTISQLSLYDVKLTRKEICQLQSLPYVDKELSGELHNGDFEAGYAPMAGSGVSSDRAIYLPEGWTIDYTNRNENDITALKSGDLYFSNFFASRPSPSADSKQTYWVRQNWGTSTIMLKQELLLPKGDYRLTADMWKSGLGGDAFVSVSTENGPTVQSPSLENKEAWQQVALGFASDGIASTTVSLTAMHSSNGSEKIIGFDNVAIATDVLSGIETVTPASAAASAYYDLQGRRHARPAVKGIYVSEGRKVVVR